MSLAHHALNHLPGLGRLKKTLARKVPGLDRALLAYPTARLLTKALSYSSGRRVAKWALLAAGAALVKRARDRTLHRPMSASADKAHSFRDLPSQSPSPLHNLDKDHGDEVSMR